MAGSPCWSAYIFIASNTSAWTYSLLSISLAFRRSAQISDIELLPLRMYCHCPGLSWARNAARRFLQTSELLAPEPGRAPINLNFVLFRPALRKQNTASGKSSFKSLSKITKSSQKLRRQVRRILQDERTTTAKNLASQFRSICSQTCFGNGARGRYRQAEC